MFLIVWILEVGKGWKKLARLAAHKGPCIKPHINGPLCMYLGANLNTRQTCSWTSLTGKKRLSVKKETNLPGKNYITSCLFIKGKFVREQICRTIMKVRHFSLDICVISLFLTFMLGLTIKFLLSTSCYFSSVSANWSPTVPLILRRDRVCCPYVFDC